MTDIKGLDIRMGADDRRYLWHKGKYTLLAEADTAEEALVAKIYELQESLQKQYEIRDDYQSQKAKLKVGLEKMSKPEYIPGPAVLCDTPRDRDNQWKTVIHQLLETIK